MRSECVRQLITRGIVVLCGVACLIGGSISRAQESPPSPAPKESEHRSPEAPDPALFGGYPLGHVRFDGASRTWRRPLRSVVATRAPQWWASLLFWRKATRFDPTAAETDRERIVTFYRDRGYYQVEVGLIQVRPDEKTVDVIFPIREGLRVRVAALSLTVEGEKPPKGEDFRAVLPLQAGTAFDADRYGRSKHYLARWYAAQGYAHAKVRGTVQVDAAAATAAVDLDVQTGASYRHGDTEILRTGRYEVDPKIIRRALFWKPGDLYDVRRLSETQQALYATGLFTTVEVYPETEGWTPRDERTRFNALGEREFFPMRTTIRTISGRPRQLSLGLGWGTDDRLRGTVGWAHRNLFGDGEQLSFTARASRLGYEGSGSFVDPALFGTPNRSRSTVALGRRVEPPYDLILFHGEVTAERTLRRGVTVGAGPVFESARLSGVAAPVEARYVPDPHVATVALQANVLYDTTDNPLDAKKGLRGAAAVERGWDSLGGEVRYWQTSLDGRMYLPLGERWMLAGRGQVARITADGAAPVPLYRRYLTGGAAGVRGYGRHVIGFRDPEDHLVGGTSLALFSLELHVRLNKKIEFVGFGDAGQAPDDGAPWADLAYGAGVGVRYHTLVGPLRVDVAYPLTEMPFPTAWRIHASIGQAF
ncbi:MAG: BamA/TamA family outer membrane protein [Nitrospiria bacterium]